MQNQLSPTLDRYVQEDLGRAFRDRMPELDQRGLPENLETLLETLKGCEPDDRRG